MEFNVTDPETGRKVKLTGDSPPSEQELEQIFSAIPAVEQPIENPVVDEKPEGSFQEGVEDVVFQLGMDTVGAAGGGYAGAAEMLTGGSYRDAYNEAQGVKQKAHEFGEPQTKTGERYIENIADVMEAGIDLARVPMSAIPAVIDYFTGKTFDEAKDTAKEAQAKGVMQVLGDITERETGSPVAGAIVEKAPGILLETAAEATPLIYRGITKGKNLADRVKAVESGDKKALSVASEFDDKKLLGYRIDKSGKAVKDEMFKPLTKQGFEPSSLPVIRNASLADKQKFLEMVDIKKQGMINDKFKLRNRPSNVLGNSLLDRYKYITSLNKQSGAAVRKASVALKGKRVDFKSPVDKFISSLDEMGIKLNQQNGKIVPDFDMSDIQGLSGAERAVSKAIERMNSGQPGVMPDAFELHRLKKYIDNVVSYGKTSDGMVGQVERILKELRHDVDTVLDNNFPAYKKANTTYSETITAIDDLQSIAGRKIDLTGANADSAVGTLLRRLSSNAQSRVPLMDAMDNMNDTARKYGATFADDIDSQAVFVNQLEKVFGSDADTSFMGQISSAVIDADKSKIAKAKDVIKAGRDKMIGKDTEKAFDMIKQYIEGKGAEWKE